MDGKKVWQAATKVMPEAIREAIRLAGLTKGDIDFVVTHQANARLIEAIMADAHVAPPPQQEPESPEGRAFR